MKWTLVLSTAVLALVAVRADEIDRDDYPVACESQCFPLVSVTNTCDATTDGDRNYLSCVCGSEDAGNRLTSCGTCIRSNGGDFDNEAIELAFDCGFAIPAPTSGANGPSSSVGSSASPPLTTVTLPNGGTSTSTPMVLPTSSPTSEATSNSGNTNGASRVGQSVFAAPLALVLLPILAAW